MSNNPNYHNWNNIQPGQDATQVADPTAVASKTFMTNVMALMAGALVITGVTAYLFGTVDALISMLYTIEDHYIRPTILGWVVTFSPIAFVLVMGIGMQKFSLGVLTAIFILFSAVMGASLGYVFMVYKIGTIVPAFFITSGMFGTMAIMGYITKADLSRLGMILSMGLMGVFLAMVINFFFMHSSSFDYILCIGAVALFTGLTAWDVQNLKQIGAGATGAGNSMAMKMAILGAVTLYLRFINIFLLLLRLMGNRR